MDDVFDEYARDAWSGVLTYGAGLSLFYFPFPKQESKIIQQEPMS